MVNKEEAEKKLNALRNLHMRYVNDKLEEAERAEIKEAEECIDDIADGFNIFLDENISDEQIRAIYEEYLKRISGSQTLGIGADLAKGVERTIPFVLVAFAIKMGVENPNDLVKFVMEHQVIIEIIGVVKVIAMAKVKYDQNEE